MEPQECECVVVHDELIVCRHCTRKFIDRARRSVGMTPGDAPTPAETPPAPLPTHTVTKPPTVS